MFTKSAPLSVVELAFCTALLSLSTLCVIAEGPGSGDVSSERCTLSSHGCGVALSGGGIPALVSALCVEGALDAYLPGWSERTTTSTVSGGTAGHAIFTNAHEKLDFPDLELGFSLKLEDLQKPLAASPGKVYFGQANHLISSLGLGSLAKVIIALFKYAGNHKNWWSNIMDLMITYPYNVTAAAAPLRANWVGGFSAIRQDKCPLSLDSNGDMKSPDATSGLIPASVRSVGDGTIAIEAHGAYAGAFRNISNDPSFTDAVGFSTAFWVANVIDSHVPFWTLRWTLSTLSAAEKTWYTSDGGNVDTTGIVNLLRTKTSRIVAFYNNNKNLTELKSPIAYLFGVDGASDNMNSIEGPALNQCFPLLCSKACLLI